MENSPLALGPAQTPVLQSAVPRKASLLARPQYGLPGLQVLRGREAVLGRLGLLSTLSERTGQPGAARWLDYQMRTPNERKKTPTLVLIGAGGKAHAANPAADELHGAVMLYEYKVAGQGTKVFVGDDASGQRSVIAPEHLRAQVAGAACSGLMAQGALAVMLTYEGTVDRGISSALPDGSRCAMATRPRNVPLYLPLSACFDATLASLGKHTRRNLRYYRRRTESEMQSHFVPQAALSRDEFLEMNRASINPVSDALACWRYDEYAAAPEMMFAGVRTRNGRWLSLIGGRRHNQVTEIDWQMNLAGLLRLSLSTVMRSYLLEHEVGLGTGRLFFNGGTPHSMRHSFACVDVVDTIVLGQSPGAWMLRALAPMVLPKNFLAQALCDRSMSWGEG